MLKLDSRRDPIILGKGVLKGKEPDVNWKAIKWMTYATRKHAVVGNHPSTYSFDKKRPLSTEDQTPEDNLAIMGLARVIAETINAAKTDIQTKWLRSLSLPPGGFSLATLTSYQRCDQEALATHTDGEAEHAFDCIASVSFGADAIFTFGAGRTAQSVRLQDGDLLIFDRFTPHGVSSVAGERLNLTFRAWGDVSHWNRKGKEYKARQDHNDQHQKRKPTTTTQTSFKQTSSKK
jgi:hypothetical protein